MINFFFSRLFPPIEPLQYVSSIFIGINEIYQVEIRHKFAKQDIEEILIDEINTEIDVMETIMGYLYHTTSKDLEENISASEICGKQIFGNAIILPYGKFFNLI